MPRAISHIAWRGTLSILFLAGCAVRPQRVNRACIRAGLVLDGRGNATHQVTISVRNGHIQSITRDVPSHCQQIDYDLSSLTLLPGLIDTHVHIGSYFDVDGKVRQARLGIDALAPAVLMNAYRTLMAGFTTIQSVGAPADAPLREEIARGRVIGPRLLTSLAVLKDSRMTEPAIRMWIDSIAGQGADVIKIYASESIRDSGGQTLSDRQIATACDEARRIGKRIWVHAHASSAVRAAATAGCFTITHGSAATPADLDLLARRHIFFEPNVGLVSQNYVQNREHFRGLPGFSDETFAWYENTAIPMKLAMFKEALKRPSLRLIMGSDASAGAHGQNAQEMIYRAEVGGQRPMDVLISATSRAAEALGMADSIGTVQPGMIADMIAVEGDPSHDLTSLRRVRFVMKEGVVFKTP